MISSYEAELLDRMVKEDGIRMSTLDAETHNVIHQMQADSLIRYQSRRQVDGLSDALYVVAAPPGKDALAQYNCQVKQNAYVIESQERTAAGVEELGFELGNLQSRLDRTTQEFRDYKAQQAKQHEADAAQAVIDKKKQSRHEYLVATFTVACTLVIEHISDIVQFAKLAFEVICSFFQ